MAEVGVVAATWATHVNEGTLYESRTRVQFPAPALRSLRKTAVPRGCHIVVETATSLWQNATWQILAETPLGFAPRLGHT
jgi:hypothetical protein